MSTEEEINKARDKARAKAVEQFSETLTGYEEIGIEEAFGADLADLSGTKQVRALGFVSFKREGLKHAEAKDSALSLTAAGLLERFGPVVDEVFPDEPVTEAGKDVSPPSGVLTS